MNDRPFSDMSHGILTLLKNIAKKIFSYLRPKGTSASEVKKSKPGSYPLELTYNSQTIKVFFRADGSLDASRHKRLAEKVLWAIGEKFQMAWDPRNIDLKMGIAEALEHSMRKMGYSELRRFVEERKDILKGEPGALKRLRNNFSLILSYEFGIHKEVIDMLGKGNIDRMLYRLKKLEEKAESLRTKKWPDRMSFYDLINEAYKKSFDEEGRFLEEGTDSVRVKRLGSEEFETSEIEVKKKRLFPFFRRKKRE